MNALFACTLLPNVPESCAIKIISLLGILGQPPCSTDLNSQIGTHLMKMATQPSLTPVAILSETLNALYDVYADAAFEYDAPVFVRGGFLQRLGAALPEIRLVVRKVDKRRFRDVRERADEAVLNLKAFIEYKANERK
jgi:hypothetical protein